MLFAIHSIFAFVFGAIFGSFFNVCIHRLPREESLAWPPSHCPGCSKPIQFYDNIPIISFLVLWGRCRQCSVSISPRYFVVELLTATVFLWAWFSYSWSAQAIVSVLFFSLLLIATAVDLEFQIIPDEISLGGIVMGLAWSAFFPSLHGMSGWQESLLTSAYGALFGGGMIYLTGVLGTLAFKKEAMGFGDVKLVAMLGAFLGWKHVLLVYFAAPVLALPLALWVKWLRRSDVIPYGPFLSLAGWIVFFWGSEIIKWWLPGFIF